MELLKWDIYEITAGNEPIVGVMFRGRVRKWGLEHSMNVLAENNSDIRGSVRFAVLSGEDASGIIAYVQTFSPGAHVEKVMEGVQNPVTSKLQVNQEERYTL